MVQCAGEADVSNGSSVIETLVHRKHENSRKMGLGSKSDITHAIDRSYGSYATRVPLHPHPYPHSAYPLYKAVNKIIEIIGKSLLRQFTSKIKNSRILLEVVVSDNRIKIVISLSL